MISARSAAQATLLVIASALLILLSPPPPEFQRPLICADVRFIGKYAHVLVNCDAESFVELARSPEGVFGTSSPRQTRPGYAVLGWMLSWPFRWIPGADPYYSGYVALNLALMILSTMMLSSLIGAPRLLAPAAIVPTCILLVNHITKAFLWTPHQQVLGLFVSMLSIWAAREVIRREKTPGINGALLTGLITGIACLVYGAFILAAASMTIALLLYRKLDRGRKLMLTLSLWASAAIPLITWRSYVLAKTGGFYSHETGYYHEFVWMSERWRDGTLWSSTLHNIAAFAGTIPRALALPIAFLGAALALAAAGKRISTSTRQDTAIQASIAFLIAAIPFYGLMGFYDPRLTASLIPPLVVIIGSVTRDSLSRERPGKHPLLPEPVTLAAIAYVALVILIPGPYA